MPSGWRRSQKPSVEGTLDPDNKPTRAQVLQEADLIDQQTAEDLTSGVTNYMTELNTAASSGIYTKVPGWEEKITAHNDKLRAEVNEVLVTNKRQLLQRIGSLPTEKEREEAADELLSERRRTPLGGFVDIMETALSKIMEFFRGVIQDTWTAVQRFVSEKVMGWQQEALGRVLSDKRLGGGRSLQGKVMRKVKQY